LQKAKFAQADLAKQKAQAEARKMDPLWYRVEDVVLWETSTTSSSSSSTSSILPEQVPLVEQVLSHYGLTTADVTPQAMTCLLEQSRRFAQELMAHAHDLAFAANRTEVQESDLKLAVQLRPDFRIATTAQIPKLHQLAQHINRMPLPPIPSHCYTGVVLPPAPYQLTARTYDIVSGAKVQRKMSLQVPLAPPKQKSTVSYGATKGRQIPIQLKSATAIEESSPSKSAMDVTTTTVEPATTNSFTATPVDGVLASKDMSTVEEKNEDVPSPQDPVPMETSATTTEESTTIPAEMTTTDPAAIDPAAITTITVLPQQEETTTKSEKVQQSDVVMKEENAMEIPMETTEASEPSKEEEKPPNTMKE
jgi:histone H3/H4